MKIIKYIFLLIALLSVSLYVFISTVEDTDQIQGSYTFNHSKKMTSKFVRDVLKNIQGEQEITHASQDSIILKGNHSETLIFFINDSSASTKVKWEYLKNRGFWDKAVALFKKGNIKEEKKNQVNHILEETDNRINTAIRKNNLDISIIHSPDFFYIEVDSLLSSKEIHKVAISIAKNIVDFCEQNNITVKKYPLIKYSLQNFRVNDKALYSIAVVTEKTHDTITIPYPFKKGTLNSFEAVKGLAQGDYSFHFSHKKNILGYIKKNNFHIPEQLPVLEFLIKHPENSLHQGEYLTEFVIPVRKRHSSSLLSQPKDSIQNAKMRNNPMDD